MKHTKEQISNYICEHILDEPSLEWHRGAVWMYDQLYALVRDEIDGKDNLGGDLKFKLLFEEYRKSIVTKLDKEYYENLNSEKSEL